MKRTFTTIGLLSENIIKDYEYEEYIIPKSNIAIIGYGLNKITKNIDQNSRCLTVTRGVISCYLYNLLNDAISTCAVPQRRTKQRLKSSIRNVL